jgi:molybdenum cofactor cytidylyltransferase
MLAEQPTMYNHKMNPSIHQALRAEASSCIAFVGAGGKTTALFQLARSLPSPVIVTATSHLGAWQVEMADRHIMTASPAPLEELEHGMKGVILVTGELDGDRTRPVDDRLGQWLHEYCGYHAVPLLIEADGSRQKPLKAWAGHEPAIPAFADQVVQVVGLSSLGKPLNEDWVHRPGIFSELSGLTIGEKITAEAIRRALTDPSGGLKNIPDGARRVVLLNQADTVELQSAASGMVQPLLSAYDSVVIASLQDQEICAVHEPVAAILLAAGESSRYGKVKQLLDWHGQPFVRAVAKTALEAGCWPVIVVTGANAEPVEAAVKDLDVIIVHNMDWKEGQASSIRAGLRPPPPSGHLPQMRQSEIHVDQESPFVAFGGGREGVGSAIFLLADQPQVTTSILRALMEKHAEGLHPVVAPLVMDRRANPVLFDRVTFPDLASLQGDVGGRAILHKYRVEYLPWHDDRLLLDVDTPEMYQRLISDETL